MWILSSTSIGNITGLSCLVIGALIHTHVTCTLCLHLHLHDITNACLELMTMFNSISPTCGNSVTEQSECTMGRDYVSVVWTGFFKAELSETYTFWLDSDDGSRLYLDGTKVVDRWCSQSGELDSCSLESGHGSANASLSCAAGQLYEMRIEYKEVTDTAQIRLFYSSPSVTRQIVPSSRLFHSPSHVQGSPFELFMEPNLVDATQTTAKGAGLSFASAGVAAHFSVVARDAYANARNDWRDTFFALAVNTDPDTTQSTYNHAWRGSISANVVPGSYQVSYTVTRAGPTRVSAELVLPGGLQATYYASVSSSDFERQPVQARAVQQLSEGEAGGAMERGGIRTGSVNDDGYTVRWAGLFRPPESGVYTFQARALNTSLGGGATERVKLWLDHSIIIDQWTSLSAADASPQGTHVFNTAFDYYPIKLEYQSHSMKNITVELLAAPEPGAVGPIASSSLLTARPLNASPWTIRTRPFSTDLATSDIRGVALTLSTAGLAASFLILARDSFGNARSSGLDEFSVQATDGRVSIYGEVTDLGTGRYTVSYHAESAGNYELQVHMGSQVSRHTLFVHPGAASARQVSVQGPAISIATAGFGATFTIQAKDAFANLRSLGSDIFHVVLEGPLSHSQSASTADEEASADTYHDHHRHLLRAKYIGQRPTSNLGRHTTAFRISASGHYKLHVKHASAPGLNASFYSDPDLADKTVVRMESKIDYNWGSDAPYAEAHMSDEWSARWEGLVSVPHSETYTFVASVAEADERVRLWVHDRYILDQWSSLASTMPSGTIYLAAGAVARLQLDYAAYSGLSSIRLSWQSASQPMAPVPSTRLFALPQHVRGSPFAMTVYPAASCGSTSTARGDGVSLATAGAMASFSIVARDHLGNVRGVSGNDRFVVRAHDGRMYAQRDVHASIAVDSSALHPPAIGMSTWPAHPGGYQPNTRHNGVSTQAQGVYRVTYTPEWKREQPSHVEGGASGQEVDGELERTLSVALAHGGGLMATYFSLDIAADTGIANDWHKPSRTFVRNELNASQPHDLLQGDERALRYKGFIAPPIASRYTFGLRLAQDDDRVRLWVDNALVLDQWTSLSSSVMAATLSIDGLSSLYSLELEYKDGNMTSSRDVANRAKGPALTWIHSNVEQVITSSRLFHAHALPVQSSYGQGLSATYYTLSGTGALDEAVPLKTSVTVEGEGGTGIDWSGEGASSRPWPASLPDKGWKVRWSGFIVPSRSDPYTFFVPLSAAVHTGGGYWNSPPNVEVSERVRLWIDDVLVVDQWSSLAAMEPTGTYAFRTATNWYNIDMEYALVNRSQSSLARGVALLWENLGDQARLDGVPLSAGEQVAKGLVRIDRLKQAMTRNKVIRDDYAIWDSEWYSASAPHHDVRVDNPSAPPTATDRWESVSGCPGPEPPSLAHQNCRGHGVSDNPPSRLRVRAGALCGDTSSVTGVGLTVATAGVTRTFTLTARDAFDNVRDSADDSFFARALLSADASVIVHGRVSPQPWPHLSHYQPGKYEVTYRATRAARYTTAVHSMTATTDGNGLLGAYFPPASAPGLDRLITRVDPCLTMVWGDQGMPTWSEDIPALGFRARWTGLVLAPSPPDAPPGTSVNVGFQVDCDGQVSLYVQGQLIASTGGAGSRPIFGSPATASQAEGMAESEQGDIPGETSAAGEVELEAGLAYDIRVEYARSTLPGSSGFLNITWAWNGHAEHIIPSEALLPSSRPVAGARQSLTVHPSVGCGATSQAYGDGLSLATAGVPASFTITVRDEFVNVRDDPRDVLMAELVPLKPLEPSALDSAHRPSLAFPTRLPTTPAATSPVIPTYPQGAVQRPFSPYLAELGTYASWGIHKLSTTRSLTSGPLAAEVVANGQLDSESAQEREKDLSFGALQGNAHSFSFVSEAAGLQRVHVSLLQHELLSDSSGAPADAQAGALFAYSSAGGLGLMATYYVSSETSNLQPFRPRDAAVATQAAGASLSWLPSSISAATSAAASSAVLTGFWRLPEQLVDLSATIAESGLTNETSSTQLRLEAALPGLAVGQYIKSAAGEYMKVTALTASGKNLTVDRGAIPSGVRMGGIAAAPPGTTVTLGGGALGGGSGVPDAASDTASFFPGTVQAHMQALDERVKVWLDHVLVIDQWTSLAATKPARTLPATTRGRGGQLVPIRIEYQRAASSSARQVGLDLKWSKSSSVLNASALTRRSLFAAAPIGTSASVGGAGGRLLRVEPNVACASASSTSGLSLTVATAGVPASFRVLIRDAFGNARWQAASDGGDQLISRLRSAACDLSSSSSCQPPSPSVGSAASSSGNLVRGGERLSTGGLRLNVSQTTGSACNLTVGKLQLPLGVSVAAVGAQQGQHVIFSEGPCAGRWTSITAVTDVQATHNESTGCLELAAVWADQLGPCAHALNSTSTIQYRIATAAWARAGLGPLQCSSCPHIVRASVNRLASSTEAAAESAEHAARQAEEVGIPAAKEAAAAAMADHGWHYGVSFTATRKGQYSVVTSLVGQAGLMATYYSLPQHVHEDPFQSPSHLNPNHLLSTPPLTSGAAAVSAKVWASDWFGEQHAVDWSSSTLSGRTDAGLGLLPCASLSPSDSFAVRWTGFLRVPRPRLYTFAVGLAGAARAGERVKLWVDNSLVIDQWSSLGGPSVAPAVGAEGPGAPAGTIGLPRAQTGVFDLALLYKCANTSQGCGLTLLWDEGEAGTASGAQGRSGMVPVGLSATAQRHDLPSEPGHLMVLPAAACGSRSVAKGVGLSLSTAGVETSFRILSRDAYDNANERAVPHAERFLVLAEGSGKSPRIRPFVSTLVSFEGSSRVTYTATSAQSYWMTISHLGLNLVNSPFSLLVRPAGLCASQSTASGAGISVASVAPQQASFIIQSRDSFANARSQSAHEGEWQVRVFRANWAKHYMWPYPAHQVSRDGNVALPTTRAAVQDEGNGKITAQYMLPAEPWDDRLEASLHVSWAERGGLQATYYTSTSDSSAPEPGQPLPAPCESHSLPRRQVQPELPFTNVTQTAAGNVDLQAAVASCPNASDADSKLVVRYNGMVAACQPAPGPCSSANWFQRNLTWTLTPSDRVKLWVDNHLLIDQWTSLSSTSPTASHRFLARTESVDFAALFQRTLSRTNQTASQSRQEANMEMRLVDDDGFNNSTLGSNRLWSISDIQGSPFHLYYD